MKIFIMINFNKHKIGIYTHKITKKIYWQPESSRFVGGGFFRAYMGSFTGLKTFLFALNLFS